jgi:hypothetical protein
MVPAGSGCSVGVLPQFGASVPASLGPPLLLPELPPLLDPLLLPLPELLPLLLLAVPELLPVPLLLPELLPLLPPELEPPRLPELPPLPAPELLPELPLEVPSLEPPSFPEPKLPAVDEPHAATSAPKASHNPSRFVIMARHTTPAPGSFPAHPRANTR